MLVQVQPVKHAVKKVCFSWGLNTKKKVLKRHWRGYRTPLLNNNPSDTKKVTMANKLVSALKNILGKDDQEDTEKPLDPTEGKEEENELPDVEDEEETPGDEAPDMQEESGEDDSTPELDTVEDSVEAAESAIDDAESNPDDPDAQEQASNAAQLALEEAEKAGVSDDPEKAKDKVTEELSKRMAPLAVWAKMLLNPDEEKAA